MNAWVLSGVKLMADASITRVKRLEHEAALSAAFERFEINTPLRIAAVLAQFGHETGGWRWLRELGGKSYFKKYDGRQDLGNTQPGDGARFRGRGYIQLTGRANYQQMAAWFPEIPLMEQPELAEQPHYAALFSCRWWVSRGLNALADAHQIKLITRKINGGLNGYADRKQRYEQLLANFQC